MFELQFFLLTLTQERIHLPKLKFSSSVGYNKFESVTLDILKSRCGASSIEFIFKYTRIIHRVLNDAKCILKQLYARYKYDQYGSFFL